MSPLTQLRACREQSSGGYKSAICHMEQNTSSKHGSMAEHLIVVGAGALPYCPGSMHGIRSQEMIQMCSRKSGGSRGIAHPPSTGKHSASKAGREGRQHYRCTRNNRASFMLKSRESLSWQQREQLNYTTCTGDVKTGSTLAALQQWMMVYF